MREATVKTWSVVEYAKRPKADMRVYPPSDPLAEQSVLLAVLIRSVSVLPSVANAALPEPRPEYTSNKERTLAVPGDAVGLTVQVGKLETEGAVEYEGVAEVGAGVTVGNIEGIAVGTDDDVGASVGDFDGAIEVVGFPDGPTVGFAVGD